MKVYFAQIMDNLAYYEHEKRVADFIEGLGHTVYFPWRDEGVIFEDQSTLQDSQKTFDNDVQHIRDCDALIAYIDGDDPGTAVEAGIAYALGKPVALYSTEFAKLAKGANIGKVYPIEVLPANSHQHWIVKGDPLINNMWLGVSGHTVLNTPEQIRDWLDDLQNKFDKTPDV